MATKYSVMKMNTTDGVRYILKRGNNVSLSYRTYYKKKSNALKKAKLLNKNL